MTENQIPSSHIELARTTGETGLQLADRMRITALTYGKTVIASLGDEAKIIADPGQTPILR